MPSLSLSGSGQPSSSWKPSLSSGSFGHLSACVGDAVLVVVGIGAAVLVLEAVLVLGLVRALVDVVEDAVAVASPGLGGAGGRLQRRAATAGRPARAFSSATCRCSRAGKYSPCSSSRDANSRCASAIASSRGAHRRRRCRAPPWRSRAPRARSLAAAGRRSRASATARPRRRATEGGHAYGPHGRRRFIARARAGGFRASPRRPSATVLRLASWASAGSTCSASAPASRPAIARPVRQLLGAAPELDRVLVLRVAGLFARLVQVLLGAGELVRRVAIGLRELRRRDRRRRRSPTWLMYSMGPQPDSERQRPAAASRRGQWPRRTIAMSAQIDATVPTRPGPSMNREMSCVLRIARNARLRRVFIRDMS